MPLPRFFAHAFVQSYTGWENIKDPLLKGVDVVDKVRSIKASREDWFGNTNESELAAVSELVFFMRKTYDPSEPHTPIDLRPHLLFFC